MGSIISPIGNSVDFVSAATTETADKIKTTQDANIENTNVSAIPTKVTTSKAANSLSLHPVQVGDGKVTGTTLQPNTSIRVQVNRVLKTIIVTDEEGGFTYKNSRLIEGDIVRVEIKVDGLYTGAKEVVVVAPAKNELTLQPVTVKEKKVVGRTTLPKTPIRMSVNGVAKTTLTTDEQGDFTYNNSTLVAGDVVKAEMKINGAYTGAKEVTVVDNGIVPAITLQEIEETHTVIKGKTTLFNNLIRVSLNGIVKATITSDETGGF
ncbi:hypothetical protein [Listeria cornellensis]|uniref:Bacterial Ig domain-containing protein n=1 Tax=Listeria cornellensis FSL F6-0969 TaxID=1265820 RepID=W7B6C7_9LIST|nr:hypothetical protein [Listeria cornellensis]EUJ22839.1 hypothetical protein PCORN_19060 [Listeria cornellensis FSL F6-0969]